MEQIELHCTKIQYSVNVIVNVTSNNNIKLFRRPISKIALLAENEYGSIRNEGSHAVLR